MTTPQSGVQTVERALELLEAIADHGDSITMTQLANSVGLPLPTAYRLLRTLVGVGYVRQLPSKRYDLGPRLIRLGEGAGRTLGTTAGPLLQKLVDGTGETANLAVLESDMVVYIAQAPSRHSMRMFTEIGRRVLPHTTGVGKAIMAQMRDEDIVALVGRTGLPARTVNSHTTVEALLEDISVIRARGWAEDDSEQEVGVRCLAVALPGSVIPAAISVSGPDARLTRAATSMITPMLTSVAAELSGVFSGSEK